MNWEAIGAVGEIIGAAAVVASLAYLASQIRQNTHQVREQNLSNRMTALNAIGGWFSRFRTRVTATSEIYALWAKGIQDLDSLTNEERGRFDMLCVDFFWAWAMPWLYMQNGVLDKELWDLTSRNFLLYAHPGIRVWWSSSPYRTEYPPPFASLLDGILAETADGAPPQPEGAAL